MLHSGSLRARLTASLTHSLSRLCCLLSADLPRVSSDLWRKSALETRQRFEASRNLTDVGAIQTRVREAQKWIKDHWHPDPYYSKNE